MPEIVPVELTLPSGTWFTLYQRGWDDADDDSLGFLGGDDAVHAFATADELSSYAVSNDDHHLGASPLWPSVRRNSRRDFIPGPEDCYDLTRPSTRGQDMLAEILVYLRIEPPAGDWNAEPFASSLPAGASVYGVPLAAPDPRPTGGRTIWEWAVAEVDGRVADPSRAAGSAPGLATPIEDVAAGVESLWLDLDGAGMSTLLVRDEEAGWRFLGHPGVVVAASSTAGLAEFVRDSGDSALEAAPWSSLRGRDGVDFEPYEDNVVDLDELGQQLGPALDRAGAAALLEARPLVQELAIWLELDDVVSAFDEDQPLGRFFVRDLLDLVGGSRTASERLQEVDFEPIAASWQACLVTVASRVHWVD